VKEVLKVLVNSTQALLETMPYLEYNVSVAAKPAQFGVWGPSTFTSFRTPATGTVMCRTRKFCLRDFDVL